MSKAREGLPPLRESIIRVDPFTTATAPPMALPLEDVTSIVLPMDPTGDDAESEDK